MNSIIREINILKMEFVNGDFSITPLPELLQVLIRENVTGLLTFESGLARKRVHLENAAVVNSSTNLAREYLGQFLINLGHLTEEQFEAAYLAQRTHRIYFGRILVERGMISAEVMRTVLAMKFRETILDACTWTEGTFNFQSGITISAEDRLDVRVPLTDIEREIPLRREAWHRIREAFPRGDLTLTLDRSRLIEPTRPGSLDDEMFKLIEKNKTIDEMILHLHTTDFFFFNRLYAYLKVGAIALKEPEPLKLSESSILSIEEQLQEVDESNSATNYLDAFIHSWRSQESSPSPGDTTFLRTLEESWHTRLGAELLDNPGPLTLGVPRDSLAGLPLSAAERYLLSRIDGTRSAGHLVRIAPLRDFETMAFLAYFVSQGWVMLPSALVNSPLASVSKRL